MTKENKAFVKKVVLALLIRPPLVLLAVLVGVFVWGGGNSPDEITVDERFLFSSSIDSPYEDTLRGIYQYSFAFCADPHLKAEGDGCFPDLDKEIRQNKIGFVVFGGDLTYVGTEGEYKNFIDHVNALTVPWYPAIGNHELFNDGWLYYWRHLGPSSYSFLGGNAKFVVIDTASGEIGEKQMEWIAGELKTNRQPLLFVISHMPIYGGLHEGYDFPKTEERLELIQLFEKYEVDYVLEGHYHAYVDIEANGVRYITSGCFSDGLLNGGERHFLLMRVYGPNVSVEKIPVGSDIPVEYIDGKI